MKEKHMWIFSMIIKDKWCCVYLFMWMFPDYIPELLLWLSSASFVYSFLGFFFYGGLLFEGMYHTLTQGQSSNQILRFHGYLGMHIAPFENSMSFVTLFKATKREYTATNSPAQTTEIPISSIPPAKLTSSSPSATPSLADGGSSSYQSAPPASPTNFETKSAQSPTVQQSATPSTGVQSPSVSGMKHFRVSFC